MEHLSNVIWSEGMYLAPHHFQAQNRFWEDSVHFAISGLWSYAFGFSACELDSEALKNGTVAILSAEGIFSDGLPFLIPECDPLPGPRRLAEVFDPARESIEVLLAIAPHKPGEPMLGDGHNGKARYTAETLSLHDENTGRDVQPVELGRKNIRLLFDFEASTEKNVLSLPIARIVRESSGRPVYDSKFVHCCLRTEASERLTLMLQELVETLENKSAFLFKTKRGNAPPATAREIAYFWLLHTVNSAIASLRHLGLTKREHPSELYLELIRLAGALCTFIMDSHPGSLPGYNHREPSHCFAQLEAHIYEHLNIVIPEDWVSVPLSLVKDSYYAGKIADERWLGPSRWIFGIRSSTGEAETIEKTLNIVKICSSAFVERLVNNARAGLQLTHLSTPPTGIPAKLEFQYFGIAKVGPCWDHIVHSKNVGVHLPKELTSPEIELFIAFDSEESA
jgi:type VI secretion system protein ImpJ